MRMRARYFVFGLIMMSLVFSACAGNSVNLVKTILVVLDLEPTKDNYVSRAYVNQNNGETSFPDM